MATSGILVLLFWERLNYMDGVAGRVSHGLGGLAFTWTLALSTVLRHVGRLGMVYDMELANVYRSIFSTPTQMQRGLSRAVINLLSTAVFLEGC